MTKPDVEEILYHVRYKDWRFHIEDRGDHMTLQVRFTEPDMMTGAMETQHGRKWMVSRHMTKSEVVATAFKAVMTAVEHETREEFTYKSRRVYGPHIDVDMLHKAARFVEIRPDPTSIALD